MNKLLLILALTFALVTPGIAQDGNVSVQSQQTGSSVSFSVSNTTGSTVCAFPYVESSSNVYGSVVPMTEIAPNSSVNIGAFNQSDSRYAWSVNVAAKYKSGGCA
jgi:hypothetical protein